MSIQGLLSPSKVIFSNDVVLIGTYLDGTITIKESFLISLYIKLKFTPLRFFQGEKTYVLKMKRNLYIAQYLV